MKFSDQSVSIFFRFFFLNNYFKSSWLIVIRKIGDTFKRSKDEAKKGKANEDFGSSVPNLIEYTWTDIEAATNCFSMENKLGQGGYGPVYKVHYIEQTIYL